MPRSTKDFSGWIPLTQATLQLRKSREQVMRLIAFGELEAEQVVGRWLLSPESVNRLRCDQRPVTHA